MADPFVAEIRIFGFNFAPKGWAFCNGQLLPISQNTALFSLLGTFYGGDGKSTFALPNLEGNVPMGVGQGAGLTDRFLGETSGSQFITLGNNEMPSHTHFCQGSSEAGEQKTLTADAALSNAVGGNVYQSNSTQNLTNMNFQAVSLTGGGLPHNNMQPYLTFSFCIAMQGVFPPRG
ncbi:MAG TPA: tail fiber protein [Candidatus Saccharimonadia bacterium]|nr:tail fiber protein [Candidatus Saccharimonadia bacterium]